MKHIHFDVESDGFFLFTKELINLLFLMVSNNKRYDSTDNCSTCYCSNNYIFFVMYFLISISFFSNLFA